MKLKLGLPIDPKTFNPLNMSVNGKKIIATDKSVTSVNAMDILETLSTIDGESESKADKIKALKTIFDKVNPL